MSSTRSFQIAARLATSTAVLMFALIVIGSIVRTTGSGLACPDWPLCHGRLIPPLQFNVLVEWLHRLFALLVGLLLFGTAGWILSRRETRGRLGGLAALSVALYFTQALLGALTVWKLLDPSVVSGHLAVALMLFASILTIAWAARAESSPSPVSVATRPGGLLPLFGVTVFAVWLQAVLGGMVSTHHASLACPDWPTCNGAWFPRFEGAVAMQMLHRWGAYALLAIMLMVLIRTRPLADPVFRSGGSLAFGMTLIQAMFGIFNVMLGLPIWLSAVHLGMATAILALNVTLTFVAASREFDRLRAHARAGA